MKCPERISTFLEQIQQAKEAGALGYMARSLVQATMPHSKPEQPYFLRENGDFSLSMMSNPKFGLPYGSYPRLLMSWITTEAVRTKERELILGDSLSGFMRELGIDVTGGKSGTIKPLRTQMERLFSCAISLTFEKENNTVIENMTLVKKANLWWNPKAPDQASLFQSTILLDQDFFTDITNSPVVFKIDTLKALKQSSMAVDLYIWITYRNSYAKKPFYVKWEDLQLQFGAGYPMTAQGKANFKQNFLVALKKVAIAYPEAAKIRAEKDALVFIPGMPDVPKLSGDKSCG